MHTGSRGSSPDELPELLEEPLLEELGLLLEELLGLLLEELGLLLEELLGLLLEELLGLLLEELLGLLLEELLGLLLEELLGLLLEELGLLLEELLGLLLEELGLLLEELLGLLLEELGQLLEELLGLLLEELGLLLKELEPVLGGELQSEEPLFSTELRIFPTFCSTLRTGACLVLPNSNESWFWKFFSISAVPNTKISTLQPTNPKREHCNPFSPLDYNELSGKFTKAPILLIHSIFLAQ